MDEIKGIRELIKQNQKIVRFASSSLTVKDDFSEEALSVYMQEEKMVGEFRQKVSELRMNFQNLQNGIEEGLLEISDENIRAKVKKRDVVTELNAELRMDGNILSFVGKEFEVESNNLTVNRQGLRFAGIVNGTECNIGGFGISGSVMTGSSQGSIGTGTIECNSLVLGNATAEMIDCNPEDIAGKVVRFTSFKEKDRVNREESTTLIKGIDAIGDIHATYGWNGETDEDGVKHGTEFSFSFENLNCKEIFLRSKSGGFSTKNRLRCRTITSSASGETWSDVRRKREIKDIREEEAEEFLSRIHPKSYRMKRSGNLYTGYIAQEVERVAGEMHLPGIVAQSEAGFLGICYQSLIPFRIKRMQSIKKKIEEWRGNEKGRT